MANLQADFALVSEADTAKFLGVAVRTLTNDRCQGRGPPYVKMGKRILYPIAGLKEYVARSTITPVRRKTLIDSKARRRTATA